MRCKSYISLLRTVVDPCLNIMQGTLGMLPEVELLSEALMQLEGVSFTMPGRRLQGTAFATEIQVSAFKALRPPGRAHHNCAV